MTPVTGADGGAANIGIRVDRDRCAGSGVCALFEPRYFDQSEEDGLALPRVREAAPEALPVLRAAASRCPAGAITLVVPDTRESAAGDRAD
ncbi:MULTISPECIES: ferredoxin [Streptomyces]|uniref:Ferredoxin n=1 Tax=Streptomyces ortus TaxID=2867268 RepID=A0ABT3VG50_9ACTN|nr:MULTISPECIES: ferredoxin [Streptomyces]MCX4238919.1 ferredoxin [Streptomyces ortus]